jgi:nucleoid-associated protein YgaU
MTADAKIGLLLSFVFIIIIAFLINGLPDFFESASAQEGLATSIGDFGLGQPDLSDQAEAVVKAINSAEPARQRRRIEQQADNVNEIRFTRQLPAKVVAVGALPTKQPINNKAKTRRPDSYVVQPGDNLAVIAMKVYGAQIGNKRSIVKRIFEANRGILDSPDEIAIGQKLAIPSLEPAGENKDAQRIIAATGLLGKVKKFAGRNIAALKNAVGKPTEYIVQPGDSLWQIAERFLGDPSRYYEIVELNGDIIADVEEIPFGINLKLPPR